MSGALPASGPGCQPTASAAEEASSRSGIPNAAFTPGPWKLEQWQSGALYVGYGRIGRDGIDGIIADWPDAGDYTEAVQAQMRANARLIAAAPELYRDLETALALVRINYGNLDAAVNQFVTRANATLRKARGEHNDR